MSESTGAEAIPKQIPPAVLLVEDENDLREAIREVLSAQGCRVDAAASGTEALRHVLAREYHIVISDIRLPGMNGLELTRLLSRRIHSPQIILITAFPGPDTQKDAYSAGATHFLPKPISLAGLANLVSRLAITVAKGNESVQRS